MMDPHKFHFLSWEEAEIDKDGKQNSNIPHLYRCLQKDFEKTDWERVISKILCHNIWVNLILKDVPKSCEQI